MHWRIQLVIVCLLLTASLAALWTAVKRNRLAEVQVVLTNVESLRSVMLGREKTLGDLPRSCGTREMAEMALDEGKRDFGACGVVYYGRVDDRGPYWVEVAPGATDFTVHGLAMTEDGVREVTATRIHTAEMSEP